MERDEVRLDELDVATTLTLLGDAVSRRVVSAVEGTGLRHGHGYLVQRLVAGPATASEIAEELGVTQQAVSKAVRELVHLGHVELTSDPLDRRRRPACLTAQGRRALATARSARGRVDDELRTALGDERFEETRRALIDALDALGLADRVRRRVVAPPGPDVR